MPGNRGQYAGLYSIAWATAQTCGPLIGSLIADDYGFGLLWWIVGAVCIGGSVGFYLLYLRDEVGGRT